MFSDFDHKIFLVNYSFYEKDYLECCDFILIITVVISSCNHFRRHSQEV